VMVMTVPQLAELTLTTFGAWVLGDLTYHITVKIPLATVCTKLSSRDPEAIANCGIVIERILVMPALMLEIVSRLIRNHRVDQNVVIPDLSPSQTIVL